MRDPLVKPFRRVFNYVYGQGHNLSYISLKMDDRNLILTIQPSYVLGSPRECQNYNRQLTRSTKRPQHDIYTLNLNI